MQTTQTQTDDRSFTQIVNDWQRENERTAFEAQRAAERIADERAAASAIIHADKLPPLKWEGNPKDYDARRDFSPGDIVENTWGYEQTNVDFLQVISVTKKFLTLRPISKMTREDAPRAMTGKVIPCPNRFTGAEERHGVYVWDGGRIGINFKYGSGRKWDGTPQSCSWYG